MKTPLELRRTATAAPAEALWLPDPSPEALIRLCGSFGIDPAGRCHLLAEGFLIESPGPCPDLGPVPHAFRLRSLAPRLWAPVDAELTLALLDDEAQGLTRSRGLIFLPAGKTMEYDPDHPIAIERLLIRPAVRRGRWTPPPSLTPSAPELRELLFNHADSSSSADRTLETPQTPIGSEALPIHDHDRDDNLSNSQPEGESGRGGSAPNGQGQSVGVGRRVGFWRALIGKTLQGAGRVLGSKRLIAKGRAWLAGSGPGSDSSSAAKPKDRDRAGPRKETKGRPSGDERPPKRDPNSARQRRLKQRQERAVRELIKDFREGDADRALRRALPITRPGARDARMSDQDVLAESPNRTRYALSEMMGGERGVYWDLSDDLTRELAKEYRKAAEEAARVGDFRRAAAIYGKLLSDFRAAAEALRQGGWHRDAALLLLHKANDPREAAASFLEAGDVDQAVRLYLRLSDHESAGDAWLRFGETSRAIQCYQDAVRQFELVGDHLAAGELAECKLADAAQAAALYQQGWSKRSAARGGSEFACLRALTRLIRRKGDAEALGRVLAEARSYFRESAAVAPNHVAYCREIAQLADDSHFAKDRETLRDWAMDGIAFALSRRARIESAPGSVVTETFAVRLEGSSHDPSSPFPWSAALISDADHAFLAESRREGGRIASHWLTPKVVQASNQTIVSAYASDDGEVLHLVSERGDLIRCDISAGRTKIAAPIPSWNFGPSPRIECDATGEHLFLLGPSGDGLAIRLTVLKLRSSYPCIVSRWDADEFPPPKRFWLAANTLFGPSLSSLFGVWSDGVFSLRLVAPGLRTIAETRTSSLTDEEFIGGLLSRSGKGSGEDSNEDAGSALPGALLAIGRRTAKWIPLGGRSADAGPSSRIAIVPPGFALSDRPFAWRCGAGASWEIAGLGENGEIHWAALEVSDDGGLKAETASRQGEFGPYQAVAFAQSRRLIAVNGREVHWLRVGPNGLKREETLVLPSAAAGDAVACFPRYRTHDLLIVRRDGAIVHAPGKRYWI